MITFVCGTHAELIKTFSIMRELQRRNIDYNFISTGQHSLSQSFKSYDVKAPIELDRLHGFQGNTGGAVSWAFKTILPLRKKLKECGASIVLCHGDTITTVCATIAAKLAGIKCAHIESGLRSGSLREPFPEEIARRIVDNLCDIAFAPSVKSGLTTKNKKTFIVGNTVYDAITLLMPTTNIDIYKSRDFAVATVHRHENIKSPERMQKIIEIINQCPVKVKWFLHANTKTKLEEYGLYDKIDRKNVEILTPMEYKYFLLVMSKSKMILTDGGSMSEEAAFFNIPCIILRMATERQELLTRGDQYLTKLNVNASIFWMKQFMCVKFRNLTNPYYHNISPSKAIVDILLKE